MFFPITTAARINGWVSSKEKTFVPFSSFVQWYSNLKYVTYEFLSEVRCFKKSVAFWCTYSNNYQTYRQQSYRSLFLNSTTLRQADYKFCAGWGILGVYVIDQWAVQIKTWIIFLLVFLNLRSKTQGFFLYRLKNVTMAGAGVPIPRLRPTTRS